MDLSAPTFEERKAAYLAAVKAANDYANQHEGMVQISDLDEIAANLWEPEFEE